MFQQGVNGSSSSDKSPSIVRKSLFKSPISQKSKEQMADEHLLIGLIQQQAVFIKALEKELLFYRVWTMLIKLIRGVLPVKFCFRKKSQEFLMNQESWYPMKRQPGCVNPTM